MSAQRVTGHLKTIDREGGTVYYAKTRVPGRVPEQTTRRLGPPSSLKLKDAKEALDALLTEERRKVGEGIYEAPASAITFAAAADAYLHHVEHVKGREQATVKDYRESIAGYLKPRWGDKPVRALRSTDVETLRDELMAKGLKPRTVVRHLTVTNGVLKHAVARAGSRATSPRRSTWTVRPSPTRATSTPSTVRSSKPSPAPPPISRTGRSTSPLP
jgi:hypothetical protein